MYKVVKATLLLKKTLRKRAADREYSKNTVYLQNVQTYKIFSPKTLHALLLNESFDPTAVMKPISKRMFGAVLFADISGFTRLSARLDSEELKLHINLYFSLVLGVVNKFSGDVIKFCGDAIIVLWPLDQNCDLETQSLAVELALKCSLQLLRICGRYDKNLSNDRPPVSLRLHCGVGCGYIHSMCLGSGDRWEFLIAGSPLKQVGIAASEAGIGEVCISREVEDLLPDTFQLEKMPLGSYKILGMRNRISNDLSSSFFLGDSDAIRKTSSGQSPARPSVSADSVLESNEQKSPSFGTVALVKGISGRFLLNLQKKDGPPEPRNSGQNRSLVIAAAQMAAIWATAQDTLNTRASRRRSATVAPSEDILDVTRNSHTIAYLDAPMATNAHSSLSNAILDEIPDPVGFAQRLRFFVQDGARDAIEQNCLSYLAELRMVVTMFIEILDLEGDFSQGLLHRPQFVICSILNCLTRFGGSLRQYVIDDKGCLAIAAFGLSGSSHEDNSIRAIETALRIRHLLNHEGISVRFGITSGKVYCGLVGTGDRCEYAMMGSSVNLAARFMANAPANEMIVSHEIYIETFHEFEYNHLTKILAKGYEHPVPAYSPTKRISGNVMKKLHTTHSLLELKDMNYFIGRSPTLAILHAGYQLYLATPETAASSATTTATSTGVASTTTGGANATTVPVTTVFSGIFSILGPPGYGKTWLLNKFLKDISTASASGLSSPPPIKHIYSIVAEEATATKRYHCLRLLFEQILSQEFEGKFSLYNPQGMTSKALLSQQNSISSNVSSPVAGVSYRKLVSGSRSILYSSVQEDNGTEHFTNLFKKWLEIHCPKLMMKDLKIGREIYESEASNVNGSNWKRASLSSPQTDEMVTDRGNLNHVTEVLSRHTLITDLLPCLEGILPIESSFSPIVSSMSHWARIKLSHQIILRVLEMAVLKKGIILTLENLQWCDMPTLDILHLLLSSNKSSPVFFLITARSITSNKEIQQEQDQQQQSSLHSRSNNSVTPLSFSASPSSSSRLCRSAQLLLNLSKRCVLEPFTTLDIKEMIELILTQQANPDAAASSSPASTSPKPSTASATTTHYHDLLTAESLHLIQQRTGGVPYLTSSLMMSLRESLAHKNFHGIDCLPTGEHNIIVNRFDKLTSTEQLILKVATVIGDTFCFNFLSQVLRHMGNGLASASIGLDSTFQRLQSSSLVVQLVQDAANSSRTMSQSQSQCWRGTGDEILPYQSFDDPSTDTHHFASSSTPPYTSQLCFQFTARNIKDCIYNLMLQSQRESVHAIVGGLLERQWGTLPELNFFEIAKHYYASNNFQKKIAYLEETLRRAHGDNEPELMKDSLHHLLLITVGYDGDSLIQHAFSTTKSKSSPTLLHLSPAPTAPGAAPGVGEDEEPLLSRWLTMKNLQHPLCLLEGINQTQSQKAMTDPFAVSYHDREISSAAVAAPASAGATQSEKHVGILSEKTYAHLSNTLSSPGKPTDQGFGDDLMMPSYSSSSKLITMKNVLSWISQLAVVQFGLGNFKHTNNLGILFLNEVELPIPKPQNYHDSVTNSLYRLKRSILSSCSSCALSLCCSSSTIFPHPEYIRYSLKTMAVLAQVHLLRGQAAPADEYLSLINSLLLQQPLAQDPNQSPSDIFEVRSLTNFLSFLKGEKFTSVLATFSSMEPSEESVFSSSAIGLYYLLKTSVELCVGDPLKSLVTSRNALSHYEKSEKTLFIYSAMVLRGWTHLFACRLDDSLQIGSDAALYATISQGIPLTLHKWAVELLIVTKILRGDLFSAQMDWEKLQPISHRDLSSPTACALLSLLNIYKGAEGIGTTTERAEMSPRIGLLYAETVPYCRYACLKLSEKQFTSPTAPLFLFFAAYAALRIVELCKLELDSEFRRRTELAYRKLEIHSPDPFATSLHSQPLARSCPAAPPPSPVAPLTAATATARRTAPGPSPLAETPRSTKKFRDRDHRSMIDLLLPCVNLVIRKFESSQHSLPICQVFSGILCFMKRRILTPDANHMTSHAALLKHFLARFEYFSLGLYYFHFESAIYLASRDNTQAQSEADQSYEKVKKLLTATSNGQSSNSPHHSSEFSINPATSQTAAAVPSSQEILNSLQTEEDHSMSLANHLTTPQQHPILEAWSPSRKKKTDSKALAQIAESESMNESKEERVVEEAEGDQVQPFVLSSGKGVAVTLRRDRRGDYLEEHKSEKEQGDGFILTQFEERDGSFSPSTTATVLGITIGKS